MKIDTRSLVENKEYHFEEDIDLSHLDLSITMNVRRIDKLHAKAKIEVYSDYLYVNFNLKGSATMICAYTLEDVIRDFNFEDEYSFTFDEDLEDEDITYLDNPILDLDPYFLTTILASLPSKVIKEGAKLPESGDGYRVLSEEEYLKEKAEHKPNAFDALKDIDIDD